MPAIVAAAVGSGHDGEVDVDGASVDHHAVIADIQGRRLRFRRSRGRLAAQRLRIVGDVAALNGCCRSCSPGRAARRSTWSAIPNCTRVPRLAAAARMLSSGSMVGKTTVDTT